MRSVAALTAALGLCAIAWSGCYPQTVVPLTIVPEPPVTLGAPLDHETSVSVGGMAQSGGQPRVPADPNLGAVGAMIPRYQLNLAMRSRVQNDAEVGAFFRVVEWEHAYPSVHNLPEPPGELHSGELGLGYRKDIEGDGVLFSLHVQVAAQQMETAVFECENSCGGDEACLLRECGSVERYDFYIYRERFLLALGGAVSVTSMLGPDLALTPFAGLNSMAQVAPTFQRETTDLSENVTEAVLIAGAQLEQSWDPVRVSAGAYYPLSLWGYERMSLTAIGRVGVDF